jgi:hypothetical protein
MLAELVEDREGVAQHHVLPIRITSAITILAIPPNRASKVDNPIQSEGRMGWIAELAALLDCFMG